MRVLHLGLALALSGASGTVAEAAIMYFSDPSGLSAEVEFTLANPTTLVVRAKNTSTGAPGTFDSADQLLTSVAWEFGDGTAIIGGSVLTGPTSASLNFSVANVGANADVSGEYGFGNGGTTGLFSNYVSTNTAGTTPFGGANLDGPAGLSGPQAGLVANPMVASLGGLGAIQTEWTATLTLSQPVANLDFLNRGVTVEFGSDAAFITVPEPNALLLATSSLAIAALAARRRCRHSP